MNMGKAQLTIEYIVILVIMLLLFNGITLDLISTSLKDTTTIQTAEMVNASRMVMSDAVDIIGLQGSGAKKTIGLRAPPDCDYVLLSNVISLSCKFNSPSYTAGFNGASITPSDVPAGIQFLLPGGNIRSGERGTVTVSKV